MKTTAQVYNIYFDDVLDAVIMEWNGYATTAQFREGTELMLNTLIQNKCSKVLADIEDMTLISVEDQQWLQTSFVPRAIKFGFKVIAIVTPTSYFNKVAVESVSYKIDKEKLTINFFDSSEKATEWLKQV
ncbi:MAG TPA: STAS/SEC14 domain-containing protein [Bacteroidia bacterium]|nr:STAS/SEC14 domain-containing protein [Bacteroidia bacterium]